MYLYNYSCFCTRYEIDFAIKASIFPRDAGEKQGIIFYFKAMALINVYDLINDELFKLIISNMVCTAAQVL